MKGRYFDIQITPAKNENVIPMNSYCKFNVELKDIGWYQFNIWNQKRNYQVSFEFTNKILLNTTASHQKISNDDIMQ